MSYIPYDIQLIIYKYLHELKIKDVLDDLISIIKKKIKILNYLKKKSFYPYVIWDKIRIITNNNYIEIDKYVHRKKMKRILENFIFNS
jgi:hypothetical protein